MGRIPKRKVAVKGKPKERKGTFASTAVVVQGAAPTALDFQSLPEVPLAAETGMAPDTEKEATGDDTIRMKVATTKRKASVEKTSKGKLVPSESALEGASGG